MGSLDDDDRGLWDSKSHDKVVNRLTRAAESAATGKSPESLEVMMRQVTPAGQIIRRVLMAIRGDFTYQQNVAAATDTRKEEWRQVILAVWRRLRQGGNAQQQPTGIGNPNNASVPSSSNNITGNANPWGSDNSTSPYREVSIGTDVEVSDLIARTVTSEANRVVQGLDQLTIRDMIRSGRDEASSVMDTVGDILRTRLTRAQYLNMTTATALRRWTNFIQNVWAQPSASFARPRPLTPRSPTASGSADVGKMSGSAAFLRVQAAVYSRLESTIEGMTSAQIEALLQQGGRAHDIVTDAIEGLHSQMTDSAYDYVRQADNRGVWIRHLRDSWSDEKDVRALAEGNANNTGAGSETPQDPPIDPQSNMNVDEANKKFADDVMQWTIDAVEDMDVEELEEFISASTVRASAISIFSRGLPVFQAAVPDEVYTARILKTSEWATSIVDNWKAILAERKTAAVGGGAGAPIDTGNNSTGTGEQPVGTGTVLRPPAEEGVAGGNTGEGNGEKLDKPEFHNETGTDTKDRSDQAAANAKGTFADNPLEYLKNLYTAHSDKLFGKQQFKDDLTVRAEHDEAKRSSLAPFLPVAGTNELDDQDDEVAHRLKAQNLLMGQVKSPNWPLGNVDNKFWVGNMVNTGMRYGGHLFDMPTVYNGGTLTEGATLYGSYRSVPVPIPPPAREAGNRKYRRCRY